MLRSNTDNGRGRDEGGSLRTAVAEGSGAAASASGNAIEFLTLKEDRKRRKHRRRAQDEEEELLPQCRPCACDATNSTPTAQQSASGASDEPRLKLRFLTTQRSFAQLQVMLEQIADDYTRQLGPSAPQITVVGVPSLEEMEREVKFDVRTRAGQFDGYIITPLWVGELADGLFELTDFIRDYGAKDPTYWTDILLFYREVISSYDNKLYLFPFDGDVISMFYRRDLLEKYGRDVPRTWDEYNELARFFHGKVEPLFAKNPETGKTEFVKNATLAGSCIGRMPACGNPYWAQTVLATMTQVRGTYEGSLLDSEDLSPLLGPAMEETLRLLGEQTLVGSYDEFEGCVGVHVEAMNRGECVLTYNWGNSFSDHVRPGSYVRGKLGVAPIPGSVNVLNRTTGKLEECDSDRCPHSVLDDRTGKYINQSPYGAYGGFSGAVSGAVSPEHALAAAEFFAFATSSKKAIKYVIPDANNPDLNSVPTGMDPYARSMLVVEEWTSRGFDRKSVEEYKDTIESQLGSKNVVMDIRFPRAADFFAVLDEETTTYCNDTKWDLLGENPAERRSDAANRIAERWEEIETDFDSDEGRSPGALLEMYQRTRGVYMLAARSEGGGSSLSTGAIVGIAVGVAAGMGILTLLVMSYVIRKERQKREAQWYIDPNDIVDTNEVLGKGSFGIVTKGFLRGAHPVALKHPLGYQPDKQPVANDKGKNGEKNDGADAAGKSDDREENPIENEPQDQQVSSPYSRRMSRGSSSGMLEDLRPGRGLAGSRQASVSSIEINPLDASMGGSLLTEPTSVHSPSLFVGKAASKICFCFKRRKDTDPLRAELLTLIKLRHDSIVQTLGATVFDTRKKELVLVLQYMQNNTIRSILKNPDGVAGTAGMALEIQWALQVARGMGFLHSVPPPAGPMLHNDLKSSNVLVDGSYNAHISDFGLATKTMGGLWGAIKSSRTGGDALRGSLLWMAPEVLNGADPSPASDVYSYSMLLVELMTRARPYGLKAFEIKRADSDCSGSRRMSEVSVGTEFDRGKKRLSEINDSKDSLDLDNEGVHSKDSLDMDDEGRVDKEKPGKGGAIVMEKDKETKSGNMWRPGRRVSWSGVDDNTQATGGGSSNENAALTQDSTNDLTAKTGQRQFVAYIGGQRLNRDDIIERVKNMKLDPPFRPSVPDDAPQVLRDICIECWHKNPKRRPTMKEVEERLSAAFSNENVTQQMMARGAVFDSILPRDVQDALAKGKTVPPKSHDNCTVIFSDIVGFTNISTTLKAEEVGDLIHRLFTKFDSLCRSNGVKKLDVIGDAFIGVVGIPEASPEHAGQAARFALGAIEAAQRTLICPSKPDLGYVQVRFGLASGSVVATVIGSLEHPKYTLFGDTVNTASRMESSGMPNRCQCTPSTAELLKVRSPDIAMESRGKIEVKGKGEMETFWLSIAGLDGSSDVE